MLLDVLEVDYEEKKKQQTNMPGEDSQPYQ